MKRLTGFTLIELLIVVAIIAILAAIAVPNFLHAQTRAKIAKVESDFAAVAVGIESYFIDYQNYPLVYGGAYFRELGQMTSPVKYITTIPLDPFKPWDQCPDHIDHDGKCFNAGDGRFNDGGGYDYMRLKARYNAAEGGDFLQSADYWFMMSIGPDRDEEQSYWTEYLTPAYKNQLKAQTYDVSNGLTSSGDIYRFGPSDPRYAR